MTILVLCITAAACIYIAWLKISHRKSNELLFDACRIFRKAQASLKILQEEMGDPEKYPEAPMQLRRALEVYFDSLELASSVFLSKQLSPSLFRGSLLPALKELFESETMEKELKEVQFPVSISAYPNIYKAYLSLSA